jgi:predicted MFS family arabinose efflux permease
MVSMAIGFFIATTNGVTTPYGIIVLSMMFMGGGLGLVAAPATEAIMGALPPAKAGVGSAVNDTAREFGGTLGVAIVGSVFSSIYGGRLTDALAGTPLPDEALAIAKESVGGAKEVARQAGATAGPEAGAFVDNAVNRAFIDGWHAGSWVSVAVALLGALIAWRFLPARAETPAFLHPDRAPERANEMQEREKVASSLR